MRTAYGATFVLAFGFVILGGPVRAATSVTTAVAQATGTTNTSTTAPQAAETGTITGQVLGAGAGAGGVPQASVLIEGAGRRQALTTDGAGQFTAVLPPGSYTLTINKGGYQTGSTQVLVAAGVSTSFSLTLTASSLNNLQVIGRVSTQSRNTARFNISSTTINTLGTQQIQERNTMDLTEILNELPGITIPHATSNPNEGFVIRGLRYETTAEIDGHPVSSGTSGQFLTNYAASAIFGGADVLTGGGLNGPISGESGIGIVNLRTPDFAPKDTGYFQGGFDNYAGTFYTALYDANFSRKWSVILGKTFTGYRGPTYGMQEADGSLGAIPAYGTFQVPQNLTNAVIPYITDFSNTYSLNAELAKLRYKFSDATSLTLEYLGLQGRYDPQGGAYGQFEGYATIPPCLNSGKPTLPCTDLSTYSSPAAAGLIGASNVPLYAFYPGSDVRQNQPNFSADFKTTIGNDTVLFRPYTAAINRLIDGTQENLVPGDNGNWYQVTNPANCQAQFAAPSAANGGAKGPCFAAGTNPTAAWINPAAPQAPVVFATTSTPLSCSVAAPCYTTSTAINNSGQYGYGSPYTTLEVDHLFGYTFDYIHPVGANIYNLSYDHFYDNTSDYINDASPLAAGCSFVFGSTANTPANAGTLGYQPNCPLSTLRPSPLSVPPTFASKSSLGLTGQFQLTPNFEFDAGGYYTKYLINAQRENPALQTPAYIAANYAGNASAVPIQLVGSQNAGSHIDPRFGFVYRPTRDLTLRFNAGSSQTLPYASLVSGFITYSLGSTSSTISTPNYSLLPEEIVQEDLGADFRYTKRGGVLSFDLYNAVVHNPWLSTKIPICSSQTACAPLFPEPTNLGYTSQTLNGAQQHAQGLELSVTDEPRVGFGYRANLAFERNYYLGTPASYFGNTAQAFFNGLQYTSTGSGSTSVPYAKGYAELQYATADSGLLRVGIDYEGNNNSYNAPAFFDVDAGVRVNTGFHDVLFNASVENLFGSSFGSALGRGVEYQGLAPVEGYWGASGATYSTPSNTALVSPGPMTWRFSLVKQL